MTRKDNPKFPSSVEVSLVDDRIAILNFENAERRNALDRRLLGLMSEALLQLSKRPVPPVVIVTAKSKGSVWSAGHDLDELASDRDPLAFGKPLADAILRIRTYPGAVLAAVSGSAWGGATDLAMSCDLVLADVNASFAMTPGKIGLPYSTSGLLRFFNNMPVHLLKEMFFCAATISAEKAFKHGLINHVVEPAELDGLALETARKISQMAPLAIQSVKLQLQIIEDSVCLPVDTLERIVAVRENACASDDFSEGLRAFAEKRRPVFSGR